MFKIIPIILALLWSVQVTAQSKWSIKFEPLYGVEHTSNRYPEPARYTTRSYLGLGVTAGVPLLSLELQATTANDRRDYPSENQKVVDQVNRGMIGLRSTVPTTSWMAIYARAGARATMQKTTITDTSTNTSIEKKPPLQWDPYAGTGLQFAVGPLLALSAGATWIFVDSGKPDVQYSLGVTLKYGQVR